MTKVAVEYSKLCLMSWSLGLVGRNKSTDVERFDPVAEELDHRRGDDDGVEAGEGHHPAARVRHRPQEVHREHRESAHREEHRARREQDRAPSCRHRPAQGFVPIADQRVFLPIPADEQQGVVDRESQAHGGGEVEREDRHVGEKGDPPNHSESPDDGHPADHERQQSGEQPAEHPDESNERQRQGDAPRQ